MKKKLQKEWVLVRWRTLKLATQTTAQYTRVPQSHSDPFCPWKSAEPSGLSRPQNMATRMKKPFKVAYKIAFQNIKLLKQRSNSPMRNRSGRTSSSYLLYSKSKRQYQITGNAVNARL